MSLFLAAAATASLPAAPALAAAPAPTNSVARDEAAPSAPEAPQGMDTRAVAIAAPEVRIAMLDPKVGPVLRIGALGGRSGAAGLPKLAHIAVGWRF